jgi:hypothetical protein
VPSDAPVDPDLLDDLVTAALARGES